MAGSYRGALLRPGGRARLPGSRSPRYPARVLGELGGGGPLSAALVRTPGEESALRFHLAVQRSRFGVLLLMGAVAAFARTFGLIHFSVAGAAMAAATSYSTYPLLAALHRRARTAEE